MITFDNWEAAIRPPENYLMHFRTPGSKNGVRRFQTKSGEWTPLGLAERKKREGWGDSRKLRKAEKRVQKHAKAVAKAEKRQEKKEIHAAKKADRAEKRRLNSIKGLTDEEMKAKLERAKMEAEYRELTKSPLLKTGENLIGSYLNYKNKKEDRDLENQRNKLELEKQKTQRIQWKSQAEQSKNRIKSSANDAKKAEAESKTARANAEKARTERKQNLLKAKMEYKNTTIRGGLAKRLNIQLTAGKAKQLEAIRKGKGDAEGNVRRARGEAKANFAKAEGEVKTKILKQNYDQKLKRASYNFNRNLTNEQKHDANVDSFNQMKDREKYKKKKKAWKAGHT